MSHYRSSLAKHAAGMRDPNPDQAWQRAQEAWREQGILVVNPDEIERRKGWVAARIARNLGDEIFGKRKV